MSSYILRCAIACVEFHVEGENVLFGIILFSCVTRASAYLLRAVNCLACVDCLRHGVDCLRRGFGSLRLQPCSEVVVRLTLLMLIHSLYVAWSFAADSTNNFNKAFLRRLSAIYVIGYTPQWKDDFLMLWKVKVLKYTISSQDKPTTFVAKHLSSGKHPSKMENTQL